MFKPVNKKSPANLGQCISQFKSFSTAADSLLPNEAFSKTSNNHLWKTTFHATIQWRFLCVSTKVQPWRELQT